MYYKQDPFIIIYVFILRRFEFMIHLSISVSICIRVRKVELLDSIGEKLSRDDLHLFVVSTFSSSLYKIIDSRDSIEEDEFVLLICEKVVMTCHFP